MTEPNKIKEIASPDYASQQNAVVYKKPQRKEFLEIDEAEGVVEEDYELEEG